MNNTATDPRASVRREDLPGTWKRATVNLDQEGDDWVKVSPTGEFLAINITPSETT